LQEQSVLAKGTLMRFKLVPSSAPTADEAAARLPGLEEAFMVFPSCTASGMGAALRCVFGANFF